MSYKSEYVFTRLWQPSEFYYSPYSTKREFWFSLTVNWKWPHLFRVYIHLTQYWLKSRSRKVRSEEDLKGKRLTEIL